MLFKFQAIIKFASCEPVGPSILWIFLNLECSNGMTRKKWVENCGNVPQTVCMCGVRVASVLVETAKNQTVLKNDYFWNRMAVCCLRSKHYCVMCKRSIRDQFYIAFFFSLWFRKVLRIIYLLDSFRQPSNRFCDDRWMLSDVISISPTFSQCRNGHRLHAALKSGMRCR